MSGPPHDGHDDPDDHDGHGDHDDHDGHGASHDGHGHAHHHAHRVDDRRRLLWTLVLSAVILVAEVVGGLMSHSLALLSDAGHMLSDVAAQVLSLLALALAARPADRRRTYGYYRIEILAALANGVALLLLAAWIFWSGTQRLRGGAPEIHLGTMMSIATIGLVANLAGAWLLHGAHSLNVKGAYLHVLTDTLSSVAVLLGGFVMWLAHGLWLLDPILSMAIGLFITYSAYRLCRDAVDVLLEAVPVDVDHAIVTRALVGVAGVRDVHDLHIWTITSGMHALSAHLVVDPAELQHSDRTLTAVKELLQREFRIAHSTIQIESHAYEVAGRSCDDCLPVKTT